MDQQLYTLRAALEQSRGVREAGLRMAPPIPVRLPIESAREQGCRESAVLVLLFPYRDELHTVFTVRSATLRSQPGDISFPGGRLEPDETPVQAALRETYEELGISPDRVTVLGQLPGVHMPTSRQCVTPIVGYTETAIFQPSPAEVAEILVVPLHDLVGYTTILYYPRLIKGVEVDVPYFAIQNKKIWGATAIIIAEFVAVWRTVERET